MRLRHVPIVLIAPLGLAAALMTHVLLQALADLDLGAPAFTSYAHTTFGPAVFVEIALALWICALAVRDALTTRAQFRYEITSPPQLDIGRLTLSAALVTLFAIVTLFGIEYSESGTAAFGLGWLGGALVPGALALLCAIATAVGALYLALAGHLAGFEHLVALFAAALARLFATLLPRVLVPQRVAARRLTARRVPVARHAGLRAPPRTTH